MKFIQGSWVNKTVLNAKKRYERKQGEIPNQRRVRRDFERMERMLSTK